MPFLEKELKELMNEHNVYSIRKQKDRLCPPGVPEDNFLFPTEKVKKLNYASSPCRNYITATLKDYVVQK